MMSCGLRSEVTSVHGQAFYCSACLFFVSSMKLSHQTYVVDSVHLCCCNKRPGIREFTKEHKIERTISVSVFMQYLIRLGKGRAGQNVNAGKTRYSPAAPVILQQALVSVMKAELSWPSYFVRPLPTSTMIVGTEFATRALRRHGQAIAHPTAIALRSP